MSPCPPILSFRARARNHHISVILPVRRLVRRSFSEVGSLGGVRGEDGSCDSERARNREPLADSTETHPVQRQGGRNQNIQGLFFRILNCKRLLLLLGHTRSVIFDVACSETIQPEVRLVIVAMSLLLRDCQRTLSAGTGDT